MTVECEDRSGDTAPRLMCADGGAKPRLTSGRRSRFNRPDRQNCHRRTCGYSVKPPSRRRTLRGLRTTSPLSHTSPTPLRTIRHISTLPHLSIRHISTLPHLSRTIRHISTLPYLPHFPLLALSA